MNTLKKSTIEWIKTVTCCPVPVSPREWRARRAGVRVFANSVPKAGTHLLLRPLSLAPVIAPRFRRHVDEKTPRLQRRLAHIHRGQVLTGHLFWSADREQLLDQQNIRTFLMIRDPRDIAVSGVNYITKKARYHRLTPYYRSLATDSERLLAQIQGISGSRLPDGLPSLPLAKQIRDYLGWLHAANCLLVRFEDLIGPAGGGDRDRQHDTVRKILAHLGLTLRADEVEKIADAVFYPGSHTFRKGQIGDWKNHFTPVHEQAFADSAGDLLEQLGYS